jgi:penicillin-binding protein 1A
VPHSSPNHPYTPRAWQARPDRDTAPPRIRGALIPFVILSAAALVAAGLFPAVGGLGKAAKLLGQQFECGQSLTIPSLALRSTILAADGSIISQVANENRIPVELSQVNDFTKHAVLAIEDHSFYDHGPVDVKAIGRALVANVRAGQVVQGGSTITQQLVKNFYTGNEQTLKRKIQEAKDAICLEQTHTKDQILELYLNDLYLGHGTYGVGASAEYYFGTTPEKLSLPQAALLAAQISSPSTYDPVRHPEAAAQQRNVVLHDMLKYRWITDQDYTQAVGAPIKLSAKKRNVNKPLPFFAQFVQDTILHPIPTDPNYNAYLKLFGRSIQERERFLLQGGLKIYTTYQPQLQRFADAAVAARMPSEGNPFANNPEAGLVSLVPQTGAIRAMVGGPSYAERKHKPNLAVQARRQAGSAFKAFTLAAALEAGVPLGKVFDTPNPVHIPPGPCGPSWSPQNAERGSGGFMDMAEATAESVNVWFAQLIAEVGPEKVQQVAKRMGVVSYAYNSYVSVPAFCSITLGSVEVNPLSMTVGFATLANNGVRCYPFAIQKIVSWNGKVLFKAKPHCQKAIDPKIAASVTSLLQGVISHGTGTRANIGRPAAGKTGTAQDFADAWFVGYVPQLATGVWVGYGYVNRNVDMTHSPILTTGQLAGFHAFGGTMSAPIWHDYMAKAVASLPVKGFPTPPAPAGGTVPNVVGMKQADAEKALVKANFTPKVETGPSTEPAGVVFSQAPAGGAHATLGSVVTIQVSNGKAPKVPVPNVVGKTQALATSILKGAGFVVEVVLQQDPDPKNDGIVLQQVPSGGSHRVGSTVTIYVGQKGPTPTPSPSPG